jgi:hypothetical protein
MAAVHFLPFLILLFVILFPVTKILQKAGYTGWWVLLWLVPIANLVGLWIFAFANWPALRRSDD